MFIYFLSVYLTGSTKAIPLPNEFNIWFKMLKEPVLGSRGRVTSGRGNGDIETGVNRVMVENWNITGVIGAAAENSAGAL